MILDVELLVLTTILGIIMFVSEARGVFIEYSCCLVGESYIVNFKHQIRSPRFTESQTP